MYQQYYVLVNRLRYHSR